VAGGSDSGDDAVGLHRRPGLGLSVHHRRPWLFGPCRYRQLHLLELATFTPRHGHPCSSRRIVPFGNHPPRPGLRPAQRTTSRSLESGAPFAAGSRASPADCAARRAPSRHDRASVAARSLPTCLSRACAARQVRFGLADLTHRMSPNGCCQSSELRAHHEHPQPWRSHWPATTTRRPAREQGGRYSPSRGRAPFLGPAAPASTTARRRGFTPEEVWLGHPLSPVDAGLRWKSARPAAVRKTAS
jgi:hypothetical protein